MANLYTKSPPPQDPKSHYEYLEQQLRSLEEAFRSVNSRIDTVEVNATKVLTVGLIETGDTGSATLTARFDTTLSVSETRDTPLIDVYTPPPLFLTIFAPPFARALIEPSDTYYSNIATIDVWNLAVTESRDILSANIDAPTTGITLAATENRDARTAIESRDIPSIDTRRPVSNTARDQVRGLRIGYAPRYVRYQQQFFSPTFRTLYYEVPDRQEYFILEKSDSMSVNLTKT